LWAAAWKTISGRYRSNVSKTAARSAMSTRAWSQAPDHRGGGVVEMGLVVVEQHQELGVQAGDLPADLRPDRAAGPGHQHPAAGQGAAHRLEVGRHRGAPQQILDPRLAGQADGGQVGGLVEHVLHAGQDLHRHAGDLRRPQGPLDHFRAG
jgi:hypothetical protein